ncbi:hypothetical protein ACEWY4_003950 [Coilia grayii]|uniref:Myb/SANT-like DNA-binding domain-containing protein n=1 Tax=Coilia grayii TaxID=363190 RepID=A0ABD1KKP9_9TELE
MAAQRQKKKPHFTAHELSALVTEVFDRRSVLFSRFKTSVTNADKKTAWAEVTGRVNAVGQGYTRTVEEVRIKWRDFSSATKRKAAARRREREQTGGGSTSLAPLTPEEERVLAVLGPEAVGGIPGGIDVYTFPSAVPPLGSAPSTVETRTPGPAQSTSGTRTPGPAPPTPGTRTPGPAPPTPSTRTPGPAPPTLSTRTPGPSPSTSSTRTPAHQPFPSATGTPGPAPTHICSRGLSPLRAPSPPASAQSSQSGGSSSRGRVRQCRRRRRTGHCQCSAELLRSEREKISVQRALRGDLHRLTDIAGAMMEQAERHHQESMAAIREQGQQHHREVMSMLDIVLHQASRPSVSLTIPDAGGMGMLFQYIMITISDYAYMYIMIVFVIYRQHYGAAPTPPTPQHLNKTCVHWHGVESLCLW